MKAPAHAHLPALAALAIAGWLAWRILTLGIADRWEYEAPVDALRWRSGQPTALEEAADAASRDARHAEASALARRALAAYPLDGRGYRVLATSAQARGDNVQAERLLLLAMQRAPRDLATREKLAEFYLKQGDLPRALHQIDLQLRIEPQRGADLLPRMALLAGLPAAQQAIIDQLAQSPPWREKFLRQLATLGRDLDMVEQLFQKLAMTVAPITQTESGFLLDREIREHRWAQAYVQWAATLTDGQRGALGNVFDGGFELPASNIGFGWRLTSAPGTQAVFTTVTGGTGIHALKVTFDGDGPQNGFRPVTQLLALAPGRYRLTGIATAQDLDTPRGLQWVIICAEGKHQLLGTSDLLKGSQAWSAFKQDFEVPEQGCAGQWLRLGLSARIIAERRASGWAAFDEMAITRLGAPESGVP